MLLEMNFSQFIVQGRNLICGHENRLEGFSKKYLSILHTLIKRHTDEISAQ